MARNYGDSECRQKEIRLTGTTGKLLGARLGRLVGNIGLVTRSFDVLFKARLGDMRPFKR